MFYQKGISLIEAIIGIAVVFVSVIFVVSTYNFFLKVAQKNVQIVKTEFLVEEGLEAVRSIRDTSWNSFSNIATGTDYFLNFNAGGWEATTTNYYIDGSFERKFVLYDVYRDSGDNIVFAGGGDLDLGTKRAEVFVSWSNLGATTTRASEIILTNLFDN